MKVLALLAEPVDVGLVPDLDEGEARVDSRGSGSFLKAEDMKKWPEAKINLLLKLVRKGLSAKTFSSQVGFGAGLSGPSIRQSNKGQRAPPRLVTKRADLLLRNGETSYL